VSSLSEPQLAEVLVLLERHHGVGARGAGSAGWLRQRIEGAAAELGRSRGRNGRGVVTLLRDDPAELAALADVLRVGETCLYRDPPQWEALRAHFASQPPPRLRGLSVGCSTGEEAWTLAMILDGSSRDRSWRVVGVDRSEPAVAVARTGLYPEPSARHLPADLRQRYLLPEDEALRVAPALAERVSFQVRDATTGLPPGSYEVIVCKNVLIYFGEHAGARLVDTLMRALAPGGVLIVARSEVPRLRALGHPGRDVGNGVTFFG
jgi:chemotaxis protein methyltransferase CheR